MDTHAWLPLHKLPQETDALLLGVSGGADSMALAHLVHHQKSLKIPVCWVHIHHGLRGAEADEDAKFVQHQAERLSIHCVVIRKDVQALAAKPGVSIEMAARDARTLAFKEVAAPYKSSVVLLAHTLEDQLETVLMKWMRGASPGSLAGMQLMSHREGLNFFRPLLDLHRQVLRDWLTAENLPWREDSSNTDAKFLRNRVRHEVLPVLREVFGEDSIPPAAQLAKIQAEENTFLDQLALSLLGEEGAIELTSFRNHPPVLQRRALVCWLQQGGVFRVKATCLDDILKLTLNREGTRFIDLGERFRVEQQYDKLVLSHSSGEHQLTRQTVSVPSQCEVYEGLMFEVSDRVGFDRHSNRTPCVPAVGYVSRNKLAGRLLTLRSRQEGDFIKPVGMKGARRKLQDIFTDAKIPATLRAGVPIVCCEDEVIWIPGYSVDSDWRVENEEASSVKLEFYVQEKSVNP